MVQRFRDEAVTQGQDSLAVEEPLEIRLRDGSGVSKSIAVTMRTPGHDEFLALGFLFSEGIITHISEVLEIGHVPTLRPSGAGNVIEIKLRQGCQPDWDRLQRHFYTSSSCGVCGKASLEAVSARIPPAMPGTDVSVSATVLCKLPETLHHFQTVFGKTGGLHGVGLFSEDGELLMVYEDIGRHNALDKLLGKVLVEKQLSLNKHVLLVSGRASFELVQKALMGGITIMAAIGAPSSLAVDLSRDHDLTLVGFLADDRFNIYSGQHRILF